MREILFRGKVNDTKEWIMGDLISHTYEKPNIRPIGTLGSYIVIPETVGQYTGLTDKNGQKIYEGDIIKSTETGETALVQWFTEHASFMVWCKALSEVVFLYEVTEVAEVIGNIHDNPELIGGEPE